MIILPKSKTVRSFFKNIFNNKATDPDIQFGRFSDFNKDKARYDDWDEALEAYEKKNYRTCILRFLSYLNDERIGNVEIFIISEEKIKFKIYQGSKLIEGFANEDGFFAEARIARCKSISLGAIRSLLEENYHLRYSTYALDSNNDIAIVLHTDYLDASPYKLYYGLKEVATRADRRDDVLVRKFEELSAIESGAIVKLSDEEKLIRYHYFKNQVEGAINKVKVDEDRLKDHPGLTSYYLLSVAFLLDYFLKPEGMLMEYIENVHKIFFHINTYDAIKKNKEMLKEFGLMRVLPQKEIYDELYNTKCTFGNLIPGNHLRLQELIDMEMKHFDWYLANGFEDYAMAIPKYIAGLLLFTYAMPVPEKELLQLLLRVLENDFFIALGFPSMIKNNRPDQRALIQAIEEIEERNEVMFGDINVNYSLIKYESTGAFAKSLLQMMYQLKLQKK